MCEFEYSICDDGTLTSPRGHIAYCARRGQFVMDNAIDGFDMFQLDGGVKLLRKFITKTVDVRTPKQVVFCEEGKALVGGSDHGLVYVFDRRSGEGIDEIPHADDIGPRHRRGHPCLRSIILSEPRKDIDLFVDQEGTTDQEEKYRKVLDGDGDCLGFGTARDGVGQRLTDLPKGKRLGE